MGLRHAMAALAGQWDDVRARLAPAEFEEFRALVDEFVREGDREISEEISEEIVELLTGRLPADHPFVAALREPELRLAPDRERRAADVSAWFGLADGLRVRLDGPAPTAEDVEAEVMAWLLAAPALNEDELGAGVEADPELIRLDDADGSGRWPAFQFAADGSPLPIVRAVNRILDAAGDPLGAADWWLGGNGRLGDAPARLLGTVPDERLIDAARAGTGEA